MDKKDYENLLWALRDGSCAIVLGPEFYLLDGQEGKIRSHNDIIHDDFLKDSKYVVEDGFFYSSENDDTEEISILRKIAEYYSKLNVPDYYDSVAQLPFYMVISLSPDDLLSKAMISKKREHTFISFKKGSGLYQKNIQEEKWSPMAELMTEASKSKPLIFNFQGICDDFQSIIFTYDSLFNFLYSIFPETRLPDNLRTEISKASTFLFLGFGYERWYLKIIFFILQKLTKEGRREKKAIFNFTHKHNKTVEFYKSKFQIKFFKESTFSFLQKLYEDCANENILQPKPTIAPPLTPSPGMPLKILYCTSNYYQLRPLNFENEFRVIQDSIERKNNRNGVVEIVHRPSVTQKEMLRSISEEKPSIIIISMHGSEEKGLLFKGQNGDEDPFSLQAFIGSIRVLTQSPKNKLQCIVFSCCHSQAFAEEVTKIIPYAIGIEGPIQQEAMPVFMDGFINTWYDDRLIDQAFNVGVNSVTNDETVADNASLLKIYSSAKIKEPANLEV